MSAQAARLYLMHGMKRSGNHAISNWLLPQLGCSHHNNLIPLGPILRGQAMPPPRPFDDWLGALPPADRSRSGSLLVTLEDHDLRVTPFTGVSLPLQNVLVLRDARQMFSSRLRKAFAVDMPAYPRSDGPVLRRAIAVWKQHARCFLGDTRDFPDRVAILFDAWFTDPDYRAAISAALGVAHDDSGFGTVTGEGGGSSFDGVDFAGRGHLMSVTDRVASLQAHERALLDLIFGDQELADLCRAVTQANPFTHLSP